MTAPRENGHRWLVPSAATVLVACIALVADRAPAVALINESPSLPRGVYVRIPGGFPAVGSVVATPQPDRSRSYLAALGMPSQVLLIKRVAAGPGDRVCGGGQHVIARDRVATVLDRDRQGTALPVWRGCRTLQADELFLLGDTPSSFDSRYFGPVRREAITGVYQEVLRW